MASAADAEPLGRWAGRVEGKTVWNPVGCPECLEGYTGRKGLFEMMLVDRKMQECIRLGHAGAGDIRMIAEQGGMKSLMDDAAEKILAGSTSISEVISVANTR
jgi:type II secretory ATPase GspE/PulE/Tfp pilus assembly ATPase PilB-like protein